MVKKGLAVVWSVVFMCVVMFASVSFGADAKAGKAVFDKNKCGVCHGKDAKGTKMAKGIAGKSDAKAKDTILKGVKPKMPSYEKKLGKGDMDNLLEYLKGLK